LIPERVQHDDFTEFARVAEPRLRVALRAAFGIESGREATAEVLAFAWEHWDRVRQKDNPVGYLWGLAATKSLAVRSAAAILSCPRWRRLGFLWVSRVCRPKKGLLRAPPRFMPVAPY
jgi:hypothetical protein